MPRTDGQPLAHSARPLDGRPQLYAEHVGNVRRGSRQRADAMLRHATCPPPGLLAAIDAAATYHDLGKLDPDNQAGLKRGRSGRLPWDHVDAGVAHLSDQNHRNRLAAWLVRAHHAPGLPSKHKHFDPDHIGLKLRGRRRDDDDDHQRLIARTDGMLAQYLALHRDVCGEHKVEKGKSHHGLPLRLALSCLVDADHADTARFDTGLELPDPPEPRWEERLERLIGYVRSLPAGETDRERERNLRRRDLFDACLTSDIDASMVACEAPVGLGKTTAVTAFLIRRAMLDEPKQRRLIIVAPFTNILTQSADRLRRALVLPGEDPETIIVEHHHRAEFSHRMGRESAALWRAPIVLTTAVSFFETLAACGPAALRKLHALPGSAVFLDEAHAAMPTELWPQNLRWINELAEHWGCRFVFASGSLVRFWEESEFAANPVRLPELLPTAQREKNVHSEGARVAYLPLRSSHASDATFTVSELMDQVVSSSGPRLVILNTVQNAAVVAHAMHAAGLDVLHLSTALTPGDRQVILSQIEQRLKVNGADWTLVATSCVEAGVDFSFRCAFRERFSAASLIQVGGRVNRHGEYCVCPVYDFALRGEQITTHPVADVSADVLLQLMNRDALAGRNPADVVTQAMREEIARRGGLGHDALLKAESERDYPAVAQLGRVIKSETCVVVVDPQVIKRLGMEDPEHPQWPDSLPFRDLLRGSVQLWGYRIKQLGLQPVLGRDDLFVWNDLYDPDFLGIMAGILRNQAFFTDPSAQVI